MPSNSTETILNGLQNTINLRLQFAQNAYTLAMTNEQRTVLQGQIDVYTYVLTLITSTINSLAPLPPS